MNRPALKGIVLLAGLAAATVAVAQPVSVSYEAGLVTIVSNDAPLAEIFEAIEREAGVELTLEDEVKSKRLTANVQSVPLAMAVPRLLEGAGVNYVVMMDPSDWSRVGSIYVGAGGGGGSARSSRPAPRQPVYEPEPMEDEFYDDQEALEALEALEQMSDEFLENPDQMDPSMMDPSMMDPDQMDPDAYGDPFGQEAFPTNPPGSSPVPSYLPPTPSFPRSRFTPGLPGNTQPQPQQPTPQTQGTEEPPPATYPFTDPFGRPIPVPPEMNEQQRQQRQRRQQQNNR